MVDITSEDSIAARQRTGALRGLRDLLAILVDDLALILG